VDGGSWKVEEEGGTIEINEGVGRSYEGYMMNCDTEPYFIDESLLLHWLFGCSPHRPSAPAP
jgi:hypothetical protein